MQTHRIDNTTRQTTFGIKVSQHFINTAHNHFNYNQVAKKRESVYTFNKIVEEYNQKYGFENYTLEYEQQFKNGSRKHFLFAINNDNPKEKITVARQNTLIGVIKRFLTINNREFANIMKQGNKINK